MTATQAAEQGAADYERILLVKPEVFMYRIPPRTSNRAYRAADWKLDAPDWSGRMRIVALGAKCIIKLEDKVSGELFAACPVDSYPSIAVESVSDSARYFVVRVKDESGRSAFIGIGFVDRSDSFDFNVALQDHFKHLKKDEELAKNPPIEDTKKLDLSFKEGQTIKINIGKKTETSIAREKPKGGGLGAGGILLPPPPSSKNAAGGGGGSSNQVRINPPPSTSTSFQAASFSSAPSTKTASASAVDNLLLDFDTPTAPPSSNNATTSSINNDDWAF